jgi:hypothetical protein
MNKNLNAHVPIINKRPSLKELGDFPERRRPLINFPLINPYKLWNENLASTKEGGFLQGYMRGVRESGKTYKNEKISTPTENLLGEFSDDLVETIKEAFILGFIQGISRK